jgi:hypothetical protein
MIETGMGWCRENPPLPLDQVIAIEAKHPRRAVQRQRQIRDAGRGRPVQT